MKTVNHSKTDRKKSNIENFKISKIQRYKTGVYIPLEYGLFFTLLSSF